MTDKISVTSNTVIYSSCLFATLCLWSTSFTSFYSLTSGHSHLWPWLYKISNLSEDVRFLSSQTWITFFNALSLICLLGDWMAFQCMCLQTSVCFTSSWTWGTLSWFYDVILVNNASVNMGCRSVFFWLCCIGGFDGNDLVVSLLLMVGSIALH